MPRSLAFAAALATVLTVAGCSAAQQTADAPAPESGPSQSATESEQSATETEYSVAPAQPATESEQAATSEVEPSEDADEAAEDDAAETSEETSQLRTGTLDATLRSDPGEPGLPADSGASIDDVLRLGAVATWVEGPEHLAISLPATSECWPTAGDPVVLSETRFAIAFAVEEGCGDPDAARTYTFVVPDGVDASQELEVAIEGLEYEFTLALPAR